MKIRHANFTLIELLIVVAIIAILAGMLLPALQSAREKAQSIRCMGNIKQLGLGVHQYCSDYNDFLPVADEFWTEGNSKVGWKKQLMPYVSKYRMPLANGDVPRTAYYTGVFRCPSWLNYRNSQTYDNHSWIYVRAGGYAWNYALANCNAADGVTFNPRSPTPLKRLKDLSNTFCLSDMQMKKSSEYEYISITYNPQAYNEDIASALQMYVPFHNSTGYNLLWLDGHASFKTVLQMLNGIGSAGARTAAQNGGLQISAMDYYYKPKLR